MFVGRWLRLARDIGIASPLGKVGAQTPRPAGRHNVGHWTNEWPRVARPSPKVTAGALARTRSEESEMTATANELPTLLTPDEVAQRLGISRQSLSLWRLKGFGPRFRKVGSRVMYDPRDVVEWLESRARTSTSDRGAGDE